VGSARRSVLLVDDDAAIREALGEALAEEGFVVHGAQNGREALAWLQDEGNRERPCVVLLDLMMPVMDGRTFLGIRGSDPSLSKIPVLVISAEPGCAGLSDTHGVHGVFLKPVTLDGLIAAIDKCP
jgi:two-component system chemotaxis response regulator CheY